MEQVLGYLANIFLSYFLLSRKHWISVFIGILYMAGITLALYIEYGDNFATAYLGLGIGLFYALKIAPRKRVKGGNDESTSDPAGSRGKDKSHME